jgi:hypothetical protein
MRTEGSDTLPVSSVGHDAAVTDLVDPGWKPALPALIPLFGRVVASRRPPYVIVMRSLWFAFSSAIVWIGVVVVLLTSGTDPTGRAIIGFTAIAAVTVITVIGTMWARRRRACVDPYSNDAGAYRSYFFACIAFGELPALVGFAFALVQARSVAYFVGAGITMIAFALIAPTRRFMAAQGPTLRLAFFTPPNA